MKSITEMKDIDREILLKLNDVDFLKTCNLNNYFRNNVCDDSFLIKRLRNKYPDTLEFKKEDQNWREYFLKVIYYISKLEEDFNYKYLYGDPKSIYLNIQYEFTHPGFINTSLTVFLLSDDFGIFKGGKILQKNFESLAIDYHIMSPEIVTTLFEIYIIRNGCSFEEQGIIYYRTCLDINKYFSPFLDQLEKNDRNKTDNQLTDYNGKIKMRFDRNRFLPDRLKSLVEILFESDIEHYGWIVLQDLKIKKHINNIRKIVLKSLEKEKKKKKEEIKI